MAQKKSLQTDRPESPLAVRKRAAKGTLPVGYGELLADLKARIRAAQVKAALAVNRELIQLYWQIGQGIVERQDREGWGQKVIDRLARDLQAEFPGDSGFSRANIYLMRQFFVAYRDPSAIVQQAVGQLDGTPRSTFTPYSQGVKVSVSRHRVLSTVFGRRRPTFGVDLWIGGC